MKKINVLLIVMIAAGLMACEPLSQKAQSSFESSNVFSNVALTRFAVNAIYDSYGENGYGTDYFQRYGPNTDIETVQNPTDNEISNACRYEISPTWGTLDIATTVGIFGGNYRGIERANIAIQGMEEFGNIENDKEMAALYGEALTIRALLYTDLMNLYGEVPARFKPITPETMYLPKADRDVLYKQLLSDLETAAKCMEYKDLPMITQAGKACAQGMYARLALQAAGYSCRPDEGYVNTGADVDHCHVRKSTDPALQASVLYPKALKAVEDVIEHGGFRLYDDFEELWRDYCSHHVEVGKEIIYGLPVVTAGTHLRYHAVPDKQLFPLEENSNYNGVQPNLYFKYEKFDQRRDVTCYPSKIGANGKPEGSTMTPVYWYCGKWRDRWSNKPYRTGRNDADKCKYTYLRYADILLMASELANELPAAEGGGLEKAKAYMRPVLVRAYKNETKADAYLARFSDSEGFFEAIKEQRAFEFAGENLRRADLIRWGILKQSLDETARDLENLRDRAGHYSQLPYNLYWRLNPENDDYLELYGTHDGEDENKTVTDPNGGWTKISNYYGRFTPNRWTLIYKQNPDQKMYRPIPSAVLTNNMGVLKNDYGYTL